MPKVQDDAQKIETEKIEKEHDAEQQKALDDKKKACAYPVIGGYFATGMTKREHYASQAAQGMFANGVPANESHQMMAEKAVAFADALLAELAK